MGGIVREYELFSEYPREAKVLAVGSPGGAAKELAVKLGTPDKKLQDLDFVRLFHSELTIEPDKERHAELNK
jgi:hypothetical protein